MMQDSYTDNMVALARAGVNILSTSTNNKMLYVVYEYSWEDPTQTSKLHWSKMVMQSDHDISIPNILECILNCVKAVRSQLEDGQ